MINDEEKDLYIKSKIKDGHIPEKIDSLFNNSKNLVQKPKQPIAKIVATAACLVMIVSGGNIYATYQGYENVFFMVKYLITKDETIYNSKRELLSDRDITISYETIKLTENISLQVQKLQIKEKEAKLILEVKEKELEKDENIVPLKYEVYNSKNKLICTQLSSKQDGESTYTEELVLKNYDLSQNKLTLKIYKSNSEEITTINIDTDSRTIEVEDSKEALQKISETELKEFLGEVVGKTCIDISNLEYCAGIYTATFTYADIPSNTFDFDMNKIDIYQSTITFKLNQDSEKSKFEMIELNEPIIISKAKTEKNTTNTTNKTQNSKNQVVQETTNQQINDAQIANNKFVGNWILAYMSGNSTEPKISDIYGEEVAISLDIKADGTFVETQSSISDSKQLKGKYEKASDSMIKMTYDNGNVVYTMYQTNVFGETILSHISLPQQSVYECYITGEASVLRDRYGGDWWRSYNVNHEENKELKLVINSDGKFQEVNAKNETIASGTFSLKKENSWDKVILNYNDGSKHELLFSEVKGIRTLHYSKGQQVFKFAEDIK